MKLFEFRKYFFDVITDENSYLIIFITILKIGIKHYSLLQIQYAKQINSISYISSPLLRRKIIYTGDQLNGISFSEGYIRFENGLTFIKFDLPSYHIDLKYIDVRNNFQPYRNFDILIPENIIITWTPLNIKCNVEGKISSDENKFSCSKSNGYIDFLKSSGLSLMNHFEELFWGRLQNNNLDFTYTIIKQTQGTRCSVLYLNLNDEYIVFDEIIYEVLSERSSNCHSLRFPDRMILSAKNRNITIRIEIHDHIELIISEFMDLQKQYNKLFTGILKKISGNPKGIKFIAKANIVLEQNDRKLYFQNLPLIDEYVRFSK
jgi:hypothetical protein